MQEERSTAKTKVDGRVCRLCGGALDKAFRTELRFRHNVLFLRCHRCASLQTEPPYWLDEAYADPGVVLDTGIAERVLRSCRLAYFLWHLLDLPPNGRLLDWGGGDGFLVRLLRDAGLDAFVYDKYVENFYAAGFEADLLQKYEMVTAFEVFEHFAEPARDVRAVFQRRPKVVLLSTQRYDGEGEDWSYLAPLVGRHVFFWSDAAFRFVAEEFGYQVISTKHYTLFHRTGLSGLRRWLVERLLNAGRWTNRGLRLLFAAVPKQSLSCSDHEALKRRLIQAHSSRDETAHG